MKIKTKAEIQKAFRDRSKLAGDQRVNMFISKEAYEALEALVDTCNITKRELLEILLIEELRVARIKRKT